jgi:glycosyltransferase involved in cell wall biosynthesis
MLGRPLPLFHVTEAVGAWCAAREAMRVSAFDMVHVHEALPGSLVSSAADRRGIPLVYTLHAPWGEEWRGAFLSRRPVFGCPPLSLVSAAFAAYLRSIEQRSLRRALRVVTLSNFTRDILLRDYSVPAEKLVRIPGGVDIERFKPHPDRRALRRGLGLEESAIVLLTVRRFVPRMGIENLLEAVALLRPRFAQVRLLVGGVGGLRARLEALSAEKGLGDTVTFLGAIPDEELPAYYQAADLFVLPTLALEGFGLATLEALACGTPVVGTPAGATPEILGPLEPRLVAAGVSAEAIAEAVRRAIDDHLLEADMRQRCRAHVERNYPWNLSVERHEALYHQCLGLAQRL